MWFHAFFVVVSLALLACWFRYTCVLILSARSSRDHAKSIARMNALHFPEIQRKLAENTFSECSYLDSLRRNLIHEYVLLTCLMRHGAEYRSAGQQMEHRMLKLDFQIMRVWYRVTKRVSAERGRDTLVEMGDILRHFADSMGECTSASAH